MTIISSAFKSASDNASGILPAPYHWDATDFTTLYTTAALSTYTGTTDGSDVGGWTNKGTGSTIDLVAINVATYKTDQSNGLPMVLFDGTNDYLRSSSISITSTSLSLYIVLNSLETTTAASPINFNSTSGAGYRYPDAFNLAVTATDGLTVTSKASTGGISFTDTGDLKSATHLVEIHWSSSASEGITFTVDGTEIGYTDNVSGNGSPLAINDIFFGHSANFGTGEPDSAYAWNGYIGEVIVYETMHSDNEQSLTRAALMNKWMADSTDYWAP